MRRTGVAAASLALAALCLSGAGAAAGTPVEAPAADPARTPALAAADDAAPWPTMRHDRRNTGASPLPGGYAGDQPWSFSTARGIFATAGVGADGTVYIGSADNTLYALGPSGAPRWQYRTGGIIDSAPALLAADGSTPPSVVIGSGDERLYRLRTGTGLAPDARVVWTFRPTLATAGNQLVSWWEGSPNVGADGTVFDGNTGGGAYAINPDGSQKWAVPVGNSVWTVPAIGPDGTTYWGSLDLAVRGVSADGTVLWKRTTLGFVTSSPALANDGTLFIGSFDGRLYALDSATGSVKWSYATGDHIYASPALLENADGSVRSVVVGSTDGTIVALGPAGDLQWSYDTGAPVRSSPVIGASPGGDGHVVYAGSSNGRLVAVDAATGALRWSFDTTSKDPYLAVRNQLNSSPALGRTGIYIGGQDGVFWYVPYDWCLQGRAADPRCDKGVGFPDDGVRVYPVDVGGAPVTSGRLDVADTSIVVARLVVRQDRRTVPAAMVPVPDAASLVRLDPPVPFTAELSGDGRYVFIRPDHALASSTTYTVTVRGIYSTGGLRVSNVQVGAPDPVPFEGSFVVRTAARSRPPALQVDADRVSAVQLSRMAVPLPPMMTSLNQIGFDFYDWVAGTVRSAGGRVVLWVIGAKPGPQGLVADPKAGFSYPLSGPLDDQGFRWDSPGVTLTFTFGDVPLQNFTLRGRFLPDGQVAPDAQFDAQAVCSQVPGYGALLPLTGMCNARGLLPSSGTVLGRTTVSPAASRPAGVSAAAPAVAGPTSSADGSVSTTVTVAGHYPAADHVMGLLLLDAASGDPVPLDYRGLTTVTSDAAGDVHGVALRIPAGTSLPPRVEAVVMSDVFPLARSTSDVSGAGGSAWWRWVLVLSGAVVLILAAAWWARRRRTSAPRPA